MNGSVEVCGLIVFIKIISVVYTTHLRDIPPFRNFQNIIRAHEIIESFNPRVFEIWRWGEYTTILRTPT